MCKCFIPNYHANSIFDIDVAFYQKLGIDTILCDLDNTLDSYKSKLPTKRVVEFKQKMIANGVNVIIISNNKGSRVKTYADGLGVAFSPKSKKPFAKKLIKFMKDNNIIPSKSVFIGDQVLTDICCGNKAGLITILTDKIVKEDQLPTKFNRIFDKISRKILKKKGKLVSWEVVLDE